MLHGNDAVTTLQALREAGSRPEAAGRDPTSGRTSQPQSEGRQRIIALLEAWTQHWHTSQLPKLQADAYRCFKMHSIIYPSGDGSAVGPSADTAVELCPVSPS